MNELARLEYLSLVSRLCRELEHHIGTSDKTLAEFIIDLHGKSKDMPSFQKILVENGAEFPDSLIVIIDRIIQQMMPVNESKQKLTEYGSKSYSPVFHADQVTLLPSLFEESGTNPPAMDSVDEKIKKFPGLALPNNEEEAHMLIEQDIHNFLTLGQDKTSLSGNRSPRLSHSFDQHRVNRDKDKRPFEGSKRDGEKELGHRNRFDASTESSWRNGDNSFSNYRDNKYSRPFRSSHSPSPTSVKLISSHSIKKSVVKRLTSPERFEIGQMIAAGIAKASDFPEYINEMALLNDQNEESDLLEREYDVELVEEEPIFLRGQTQLSINLSPIRVVKNPDGSLQRAALNAVELARERRELKQQAKREEAQQIRSGGIDNGAVHHSGPMISAQTNLGALENTEDILEWRPPLLSARDGKLPFARSIKEQRSFLPVFQLKHDLLQAVRKHQILIVVGDTGSGKTTQLTQYLYEAGWCSRGKLVGCTQPRRVAATSVAKRVAQEMNVRLGSEVGYAIRFEDITNDKTRIKYMTDGMLLRECLLDPELSRYSVIMLDEAHERTLSTDVLFGLMKKVVKKRPDLRLIVTSATLDAEKFSEYFDSCPVFTIPGRTYPVEILWATEPTPDYLDATLLTVLQIHLSEPPGDILIFLTGQEEIDTACDVLNERIQALGPAAPPLLILPVYAALPSEAQAKIFSPAPEGSRKAIFATNIAETSITIDGIYYVVDPGFVKQKAYNPRLGMDSLVVTPISQAQARQRAGRAGRTGPGKSFRLYTESAYTDEMLPCSIPEIQRTNLATTVLTLKAMGIHDLLHFPFMDPPPLASMTSALRFLHALGALDTEGALTPIGRRMAEFPLEPPLAKTLLAAVSLGCAEEAVTVVAMTSVPSVFARPRDKQAAADAAKARFHAVEGDHVTLLKVYAAWRDAGYVASWASVQFLHQRSLSRARDIRRQLIVLLNRYRLPVESSWPDPVPVCKAFAAGFFTHAARRGAEREDAGGIGAATSAGVGPGSGGFSGSVGANYRTLTDGQLVFLHPSSSLISRPPDWVLYHELVLTSKEYMRDVTVVDPRWLAEFAPSFFKLTDPKSLSKKQREMKLEPLLGRHEAPNEWRLAKRMKAPARASQTF